MTRILVIQPACPTYRRRFFENVADKLEVMLVCSEISIDGTKSDALGISCPIKIVDDIRFGNVAVWQKGVVHMTRSMSLDVLVVNGNPRYLSTLAAIVTAKLRGIKVVWWGHAMSSTSVPRRARIRFLLMRLSDRILLYYPEEIVSLPAALRSRAVGLGNSVDTRNMLRIGQTISAVVVNAHRQSLGLEGKAVLLTVGRLTEKAHVDVLLRAVSVLNGRGRAVALLVIGGGDCEEQLKDLASVLGVSDSIIWIGPLFEEEEIAIWMKSADLFVYGGEVGLSLIHAFAYGLPCVISDDLSAHNPEALLFRDGEHGSFFKKDDPIALAAVLKRELSDLSALRKKGAQAQNMVRDRLSIERMAENFVRHVGELQ